MSFPLVFLKCVARAIIKNIGNQFGVGIGGDVAVDVWESWKREKQAQDRAAELQALAQASMAEIKSAVAEVVRDVASDRLGEFQQQVAGYLLQVPAMVRRTLRRPGDPSGQTIPPGFAIQKAEDLAPLLPERPSRFQPGDRPLPGVDWELVELLGVGGFGEVWKAKNPHFDGMPPVALKFCYDAAARDRILRHEAGVLNQVMRQGRHPGIVALQHTYLSADPPCLEYEFVAGGDLVGLIREWHGQAPGRDLATRAANVIHCLAETAAFTHRLQPAIVHRDLKPANVLVQRGADNLLTYRVADFGIGGVMAEQVIARTRTGTQQGRIEVTALRGAYTPLYSSPQQMRGAPPDPRDDVHALGVTWYQMLIGDLSAGRPGGTRWMQRLMDQGMAAPLVELLAACMEEDPADRPANGGELTERLGRLLGSTSAPSVVRPSAPVLPAPTQPGLPPKELTNSIGMKFVAIPTGSFQMGSPDSEAERINDEGPQRRVRIAEPFHMGIYPVKQRHYAAIMGVNPSEFEPAKGATLDHPVEQVSWDDAVEFCRRLSTLADEVRAGRHYRLPTEAEWEYCCRAGTTTPFAFGAALDARQANFDGNYPYGGGRKGNYLQKTSAVGAYPPNGWGLFDMHGNVWEWCADWYAEKYYQNGPTEDPDGPANGDKRVVRGGSWNSNARSCRSANRYKYKPSQCSSSVGFRVVAVVG